MIVYAGACDWHRPRKTGMWFGVIMADLHSPLWIFTPRPRSGLGIRSGSLGQNEVDPKAMKAEQLNSWMGQVEQA